MVRVRRQFRRGGKGSNGTNLRRETRAPDTRLPASLRATLGLGGNGGGGSSNRNSRNGLPRKRSRKVAHVEAQENLEVDGREDQQIEANSDAKEIGRLEKLLGIGKKRRRLEMNGEKFSYLSLFGDDEKDLAELADLCSKNAPVGGGNASEPEDAPDPADELYEEEESEADKVGADDIVDMPVNYNGDEERGDTLPSDDDNDGNEGFDDDDAVAIVEDKSLPKKRPELSNTKSKSQSASSQYVPPSKCGVTAGDASNTKAKPQSASNQYVPPSKRGVAAGDTLRIGRRFRGLLNRLASANASGIASSIEPLLRSPGAGVSRISVVKLYVEGALDAVRDGSAMVGLSPFVAPHAAIVVHLSAIFDMRVMAEVLAGTVRRICDALPQLSNFEEEAAVFLSAAPRRPVFGYVAFIGALYMRGAISSSVVHELVRSVADGSEKERVELLLVLFRQIGAHLRKEDPISLKDMIAFLRDRFDGERQNKQNGAKITVMLDLISAVKNNRLRKGELVEQDMQFNWVAKLNMCLSASFADLLNDNFTDTRWWESETLGSAGKGVRPKEKMETGEDQAIAESIAEDADGVDLNALATSLRLNTDFRRTLFGAIMSSVSVTDAFERVERLGGLMSSKGRNSDCARVVLHCCAAEKGYNPFYALLAERLCKHSRSMRFTFEHAICDIFRVVEGGKRNVSKRRISNYAQFVAELIGTKSQTIAVFKNTAELSECRGPERELYVQILSRLARQLRRQAESNNKSANDLAKQLFGKLSSAEKEMAGMVSRFLLKAVELETSPQNAQFVVAVAEVLA